MPADGSRQKVQVLIPYHTGYTGENIIYASTTLDQIKPIFLNDVLHMHNEQDGQEIIAVYCFELNIGQDSSTRGGRTKRSHVEGRYGRIFLAVSVALYDVHKYGQPEIIRTHDVQTPHMNSSYITVEQNVTDNGHVTGGWLDFITVRQVNLQKFPQTVTLEVENLVEKHKTIVAPFYRVERIRALRLMLNSEILTP